MAMLEANVSVDSCISLFKDLVRQSYGEPAFESPLAAEHFDDRSAERLAGASTELISERVKKVVPCPAVLPEVVLRVEDPRVHGKIDLVATREDGDSLVEYKTGEEKAEHEKQSRLYAFLWWEVTGRVVRERQLLYPNQNPVKLKDIRHVYLDLDRKGDQALEAIRNSTDVPPPNFVLDTSLGKHQVVWKVSGFSQDEAESLLHSLANKFGGDLAATDSTRVLRLPGFANKKLPEEFIVQARQESDAVYTLRDFTIDDDSPEAPRHFGEAQERRRNVPSDHKSQSEHDWAYAKRALARGDDPDLVIQRIADYRADDKSDRTYYARRTVARVQARLTSESQSPEAAAVSESQSPDRDPHH
jgi:hypothetical protein